MALNLVFNDTFTEPTSDTALTAHTPDTGVGWDVLANSGGSNATVDAATDSLNKPFYSGSDSGYVIDVTAGQDDNQAAELTVNATAVIAPAVQLQNDSTSISGYYAWYDTGSNQVRLSRLDDGTPTVLSSYFQAEGSSDKLTLEINSSGDLEVFLNDSSVITTNDTTYTGGLPGLWADNPALDDAADGFSAWMGESGGGGGDTTAPAFSVVPVVTAITQTAADLDATINETGDIHWVVVAQADTAPSISEIQAGQESGGGAPIDSGSALAGTVLDTQITGLTAGTDYAVYLVAQDDEGTPNVQASATQVDFSTAAAAGTLTSTPLANLSNADQSPTGVKVVALNLADLTVAAVDLDVDADGSYQLILSDAGITADTTYAMVEVSSDNTIINAELKVAT